ncbi:hypothetical protein Cus16_0186 [Curtobacterium sp. ER1/6]|nr:hypothetical protein Cus16_0186 [Curtobacterium sp. ER1/6]
MVGVADRRAHQEPVELRLRQAVRAGLLDGVLRRDDHERCRQGVACAVDGDGGLLHRLEQRRLGLRAGPVDLVGEHDVREDRTAVEVELLRALVVDADARDVPGQQVRCELDAVGGPLHALRHRAREARLARPGDVLEQQVALAQHGRDGQSDDERLAQEDLLDVRHDATGDVGEPGGLLGGHAHAGGSSFSKGAGGAAGPAAG